jgi:hypothetical protein
MNFRVTGPEPLIKRARKTKVVIDLTSDGELPPAKRRKISPKPLPSVLVHFHKV